MFRIVVDVDIHRVNRVDTTAEIVDCHYWEFIVVLGFISSNFFYNQCTKRHPLNCVGETGFPLIGNPGLIKEVITIYVTDVKQLYIPRKLEKKMEKN